jgi:DNA-3-methyladenine glycosylase
MEVMYQQAGTIYIYSMHGHQLLNIITQEEGVPHGVLIRAIEPVSGGELMAERRKKTGVERTNGPGKLTKAMGIDEADKNTSILKPPLYIDFNTKREPKVIEESPRIGIPNKGIWTEALLRYSVRGNPYVSKKRGTVSIDNGWATMVK